jgi:hypothetical protein
MSDRSLARHRSSTVRNFLKGQAWKSSSRHRSPQSRLRHPGCGSRSGLRHDRRSGDGQASRRACRPRLFLLQAKCRDRFTAEPRAILRPRRRPGLPRRRHGPAARPHEFGGRRSGWSPWGTCSTVVAMILKSRWSRKPSAICRTQHCASARAIGPSNRCGRSSTVPAIRAENTTNASWLNAWGAAVRSQFEIENRGSRRYRRLRRRRARDHICRDSQLLLGTLA